MALLRHLWPRSLAGQLIVSLLATLAVAQLIVFAITSDERRSAVERTMREEVLARTIDLARAVADVPLELQGRFARSVSDRRLRFEIADTSLLAGGNAEERDPMLERRIAGELGKLAREVRVSYDDEGFARWFRPGRPMHDGHRGLMRDFVGLTISINLASGRWLNLRTLVRPQPPTYEGVAIAYMAATALALIVIIVLVVRRITRPLRALAGAADALGRGEALGPLPESGPSDVRQTVAAFNAMQERLKRFVDDRTRMLAAISHDLRTPLTALKLRVEMLEDTETRAAMTATLTEMQSMVEATLAFARDDAAQEETRRVDLGALVDSLVEDLVAMGKDVTFADAQRLALSCRPTALKRALRNLIENAVQYGSRARVRLARDGDTAVIEIDDDGQGIPEEHIDRVFEPFVRLESSRSRDTGGIGLGLSIARTIVRAHGGNIQFVNRTEGGLRAVVTLPGLI